MNIHMEARTILPTSHPLSTPRSGYFPVIILQLNAGVFFRIAKGSSLFYLKDNIDPT